MFTGGLFQTILQGVTESKETTNSVSRSQNNFNLTRLYIFLIRVPQTWSKF